jgi:uncharacterized protein YdeI (YjbR/CyaY-like superfamily)
VGSRLPRPGGHRGTHLAAALEAEPSAVEMFGRLSSQNRYVVLYRITTAKRAETRRRRIAQFVGMPARGETTHPQRPNP